MSNISCITFVKVQGCLRYHSFNLSPYYWSPNYKVRVVIGDANVFIIFHSPGYLKANVVKIFSVRY